MTYVPKVCHDVFICHAHTDDRPRGKGWVSQFKKDLESNLKDRLGPAADVFMDDDLSEDERYRPKLREQVQQTALFVPVMSPSLLRSEFCRDEFGWFRSSQRAVSANTYASLIFKAVKLPDLGGIMHYYARGVGEVKFFVEDNDVNVTLVKSDPRYEERIQRLGGSIATRLEDLRSQFAPVFVVYTSNLSLKDEVKRLEAVLFDDGHPVLPGAYIPDLGEAQELLRTQIEEAQYCVFLLGSEYSPELADLAEIASQHEKRSIFWISSSDYKQMTAEQRTFVERIEKEELEFYRGNLASKFYERLKLEPGRTAALLRMEGAASATSIRLYVICDHRKSSDEKTSEVVDRIKIENSKQLTPVTLARFEPLPPPQGQPSEVIRGHQENLGRCDAVFVYWDQGDRKWLRQTWTDIKDRKREGLASYKAAVIFASNPSDADAQALVRELNTDEEEKVIVEDQVIGKVQSAPAQTTGEKRYFDPSKLHRFLSSLI